MSLVRIKQVVPLGGHCVRLSLTDGRTIERDVAPLLSGRVFEAIRRDAALFRQVRVEHGTLVWPGDVDLCPDVLIWQGPPPETGPNVADACPVQSPCPRDDFDRLNENTVEQAALDWFKSLGYAVLFGPNIAPGEPQAERRTFGDVVLIDRLRAALTRINPDIPAEALEEAIRKATRTESPSLVENNRRFHRLQGRQRLVEVIRPIGAP